MFGNTIGHMDYKTGQFGGILGFMSLLRVFGKDEARIWRRGYGLSWSALRWVMFGGWLASSKILRVAQNDKEAGVVNSCWWCSDEGGHGNPPLQLGGIDYQLLLRAYIQGKRIKIRFGRKGGILWAEQPTNGGSSPKNGRKLPLNWHRTWGIKQNLSL